MYIFWLLKVSIYRNALDRNSCRDLKHVALPDKRRPNTKPRGDHDRCFTTVKDAMMASLRGNVLLTVPRGGQIQVSFGQVLNDGDVRWWWSYPATWRARLETSHPTWCASEAKVVILLTWASRTVRSRGSRIYTCMYQSNAVRRRWVFTIGFCNTIILFLFLLSNIKKISYRICNIDF